MIFFGIAMYVLVVFFFIVDVLRQHSLSGAAKALWIVGFFVLPIVALIGYGFWRMRQSRGLPDY